MCLVNLLFSSLEHYVMPSLILLLGFTSKILYAFVTFPTWASRVAHLLFLI